MAGQRRKSEAAAARRPSDPEKTRYVARRFVPVLAAVAAADGLCLVVDISKIHWVAAIGGFVLAVWLFVVRSAAEKRFAAGESAPPRAP